MMGLIRCKEDCLYQKEGYCGLDKNNEGTLEMRERHNDSCIFFKSRPDTKIT